MWHSRKSEIPPRYSDVHRSRAGRTDSGIRRRSSVGGGSESGGGTFLSKSVPKPHIFPISEARPYGGVQECLDVANGEPTITRTRRSGALLDVVYDRLCVWLWDETRPMGVVPGALLTMAEMVRMGRHTIGGVCSPARRSRPVKNKGCVGLDERGSSNPIGHVLWTRKN
jgi:hypothetical protein